MEIYRMNGDNIPAIATLMSTIKPEWWNFNGAVKQLSDISSAVFNIGWLIGETEESPLGWLLCSEHVNYSCLNIECLGYAENGEFVAEEQLEPLLVVAERYAVANDHRLLRYVISSPSLSCHEMELDEYWESLKELKSYGRKDYDYMIGYGFKPAGFLPNCYGKGIHGVMLIKELKVG